MKIENYFPSTFFCFQPNLTIRDEKNNLFYFHKNSRRAINFNLPTGFFHTNNIILRKLFSPYKVFTPFLSKGFLSDLKVKVEPNPNKASIFIGKKLIVIDPKFANHVFKPVTVFCLAHELHHFIFFPKTLSERVDKEKMIDIEKKCDEGAVNYMLSCGYNPTQIKIAKEFILSNKERGKCVDELTVGGNYRR